jgi:hypothetical protein
MRRMLVAGTTVAVTLVGLAGPAQAHEVRHWGDTARGLAKEIGCRNFRHTGGGALNKDAGVCWVKGKRVNVITFKGAQQERDWNTVARFAFGPRYFWARGQGAVVVAKNGNRPAARVGANRLPGKVVHG